MSNIWRYTVIELMERKDPQLMARCGQMHPSEIHEIWVKKYPEDFPNGGTTSIYDLSAIKMPEPDPIGR